MRIRKDMEWRVVSLSVPLERQVGEGCQCAPLGGASREGLLVPRTGRGGAGGMPFCPIRIVRDGWVASASYMRGREGRELPVCPIRTYRTRRVASESQ